MVFTQSHKVSSMMALVAAEIEKQIDNYRIMNSCLNNCELNETVDALSKGLSILKAKAKNAKNISSACFLETIPVTIRKKCEPVIQRAIDQAQRIDRIVNRKQYSTNTKGCTYGSSVFAKVTCAGGCGGGCGGCGCGCG